MFEKPKPIRHTNLLIYENLEVAHYLFEVALESVSEESVPASRNQSLSSTCLQHWLDLSIRISEIDHFVVDE